MADQELRELERRVAVGDRRAGVSLAHAHARRGDVLLAYLLHWQAQAPEADRAGWGEVLAVEQRDVVRELARSRGELRLATEGAWRGRRLWTVSWAWEEVSSVLDAPRPVLAAWVSSDPTRTLLRRLSRLPCLAAMHLSRCYGFDGEGLELLSRARVLGELRLSGPRITNADLARLAGFPSLVALSLARAVPHYRSSEFELDDSGLEALRGCRRLAYLGLFACSEVSGAGVRGLAELPALAQVHLGLASKVSRADLRALLAARPGLDLNPRGQFFEEHVGDKLAHRASSLIEDFQREGPPELEVLAGRCARELVLADAAPPALAATVSLMRVGLQTENVDRFVRTAQSVEELVRRGGDAVPLLRELVPHLTHEVERAAGTAERVLRMCALRGADLRPLERALRESPAQAAADLWTLARACARLDPETLEQLREREYAWSHRLGQPVCRLLEWGLAHDDPAVGEDARQALRDRRRDGPGLGRLLARALREDDATSQRRAAQAVQWMARDNRAPGPTLAPLVALLRSASDLAPLAGDALWACARRGHDLNHVLAPLTRELGAPPAWDRTGASPELAVWLVGLGVEESLPDGCSHTRRFGESDEEIEEEHPHPCGVCRSKRTRCIHTDGYGSNAGCWYQYEYLCQVCGKYTLYEYETG